MKIKTTVYIMLIGLIIIIAGAVFVFAGGFFDKKPAKNSFDIDVFFFKVGIAENGSSGNNLKITNLDELKKDFNAKITNLEGLVRLNESGFQINGKGEYNLRLEFNGKNKSPGVYLG